MATAITGPQPHRVQYVGVHQTLDSSKLKTDITVERERKKNPPSSGTSKIMRKKEGTLLITTSDRHFLTS